MLFLISALRAVVEMVGLCLLGQGALYLLAGSACCRNPVYRFFAVVTAPPRRMVRSLVPSRFSDRSVSGVTLLILLFFWIGLAWMRKFI